MQKKYVKEPLNIFLKALKINGIKFIHSDELTDPFYILETN